MINIIVVIILAVFSQTVAAKDCVILLHGLAKSDRDMKKLTQVLTREGFLAVNYDYPSRKDSVENLANNAIGLALESCKQTDKVHFVTHSMGGILVRYYLSEHVIENLGRVVMLGPPNNGSEAADAYQDFPGFSAIAGPAGLQLGTGDMSITNKIGSAKFELGIIAGTRSVNLVLSAILPGKDDGKVTVESTKLAGMTDHISMPVTHPFMMKNSKVIDQVLHFIKHGQFKVDA
ncbi:esterase/lipase family protein [Thalassotalea sp. PLHSN55]|uniref:esterase/lipase family protein n=1 Tax=Thalassotalea sp. PLHSN55 TaxID=3435888 RepID=UPI003F8386E0